MTTKDTQSRRSPRFARVDGKGLRLTQRDLDILRAVFRYRFLRSSHIAPLVGGSHQQVLRRLRLLFDHGFLDRPQAQAAFRVEPKNEPLIYGLGTRGAAALAEADPSAAGRVDWTTKNKKAGVIFLEHTLMISDVMVAFELACRDDDTPTLIDESEAIAMMPQRTSATKHPLLWKTKVSHAGRDATAVGLIPDRVFSLALDGKGRTNFMLEADRGTMRVTPRNPKNALVRNSFNRKLLGYHAGWKAKYHTERFGWQNFRVLTATTSQDRIDTMVTAVKDMTGGRGTGLFLFADIASLTPANPLTHPWIDGKGNEVRLLD